MLMAVLENQTDGTTTRSSSTAQTFNIIFSTKAAIKFDPIFIVKIICLDLILLALHFSIETFTRIPIKRMLVYLICSPYSPVLTLN